MWDGLYRWENVFFTGAYDDIPTWSSDMINDWAKVFYKHKYPDSEIDFVNPLLNHLYYETQQ